MLRETGRNHSWRQNGRHCKTYCCMSLIHIHTLGSQQRWPSKILSTFIDLTVHVIQPCPDFASWSQSVIICKFLTGSTLSEEDICITFTHPHFWSQCVSKDSQQREPSKIIPFKDLTHPVYASWLQPVTICMLPTARALGEENISCYSPTHPYLYYSPILNSPISILFTYTQLSHIPPYCWLQCVSTGSLLRRPSEKRRESPQDQGSILRCMSNLLCQGWHWWSSLWWWWWCWWWL